MAMRKGPWRQWDRDTRTPVPPPPPGSCDCQFHIYEDPAKFPPGSFATYAPPQHSTFADAVAMHAKLGFARGVIVHSTVYGSDHTLLLHVLENLEPALRKRYRATGILGQATSDRELARLDAAGVVGVRLNIARMFGVTPSPDEVRRTIDRVRELGWHIRVHVRGNDLIDFSDVLKSVRDIPMVIDHLGHVDLSLGVGNPVVQWILDILKRDNWWLMASNGNRDSSMEAGWDDAVPIGRAYVGAAPDRIIWATDWPHPMWSKRMMNDAEEVELLYRYADNDAALIRSILVDNPARLHGFAV